MGSSGRLWHWIRWIIVVAISQAILLVLLAWILPGFELHSVTAALLAGLIISGATALSWPLIYRLAMALHPLLFPLASFVLTAWVVSLSGDLVDLFDDGGIQIASFWTAILIAMGLTIGNTLLGALFSLDEEDAYERYIIRPLRRTYRDAPRVDTTGFIFVEIDGLAEPILKQALAEGYLPHVQQWLESGSYQLRAWEPDLSSQTSASQAGILLGDNTGIPAFRWWDKATGTLMVSSKIPTARALEARLSTGEGLLAPAGGGRWNVFSGDAPDCVGVFSKIGAGGGGQRSYYAYFSNPYSIARTIGLFVADVVRERYQARRQRALNVEPRIQRGYRYALVRAATTVALQEAGAFMLAADMLRGAPAVYCTFFAYDEVAHHSGIDRIDAFKVLRTVDQMVARLERVGRDAARPYHLILLSDHGQSQGATFKQRYGYSLAEFVTQSTSGAQVVSPGTVDEGYGQINAALTESIQRDTRSARLVRRAFQRNLQADTVELGQRGERDASQADADVQASDAVVLASGNLGLISFPAWPERMTLEQLAEHFPRLIPALASHPGISVLLVHSDSDGGLAIGAEGIHYLDDGHIAGSDPLAIFGPRAAEHLRRTDGFENAPDILLISMFDVQTGEVAAFEELVGSHGGLGGTQTQPFLLYPAALPHDPTTPIVGAASLHAVLKGWVRDAQTAQADVPLLDNETPPTAEP